jgi:hypothetical protein
MSFVARASSNGCARTRVSEANPRPDAHPGFNAHICLSRDDFVLFVWVQLWQRTIREIRSTIPPLSAEVRQIQMSELRLWNDEASFILSDALEECCN